MGKELIKNHIYMALSLLDLKARYSKMIEVLD